MKKLNNGGWGLTAMLTICGIMVFALIVVIIIYESTFNGKIDSGINNNVNYSELENTLLEAGKNYVFDNYNDTAGDIFYITLDKLQIGNYIGTLTDKKGTKCNGYIKYQEKGSNDTFDAYIKCGFNYTTDGYNKEITK